MATKAELLTQAKELGLEFTEGSTIAEIKAAIDNQKAQESPEVSVEVTAEASVEVTADPETTNEVSPAPVSEGSEIAGAIVEGMKNAGKGRPIKITADKSVQSMFSVVRSKKTGEVMLRENSSGVLSKVQLQSIEEKEASIQGEEVEVL